MISYQWLKREEELVRNAREYPEGQLNTNQSSEETAGDSGSMSGLGPRWLRDRLSAEKASSRGVG